MRAGPFVWAVWAAMLAADLWLVVSYGSRLPRQDDWFLTPALTGDRPVDLSYLWQLHNEHRVPLPRLILLALHALTGNDFRAGMFLNALLLGGACAGLIIAARRLRGRAALTDVFLPLALLSWAHCVNLLWSWQLQFVLSTALALGFLAAVALGTAPLTPAGAAATGLCVLLLPGCGANGLLLVPPLALWLISEGVASVRIRDPGARRAGAIALALVALTGVECALYALSYRSPRMWPRPGPAGILTTALQFLATPWGIVYPRWWPAYTSATLFAVALGLVAAVSTLRRSRGERALVCGFVAVVLGIVCLAFGVAWGRSGFPGPMGITWRYVTLSVPALCAAYLMLALADTGTWTRWAQGLFVLGLMATLWHNTEAGLRFARAVHAESERFARDLQVMPPEALVDAYRRTGMAPDPLDDPNEWVEYLRMLRRARLGPFRHMADEPRSATIRLPLENRQSGGVFHLARPQRVFAVHIHYRLPESDEGALLVVSWRAADGRPWTAFKRPLPREGKEDSAIVWIDDVVSDLTIVPDARHPADAETKLLGAELIVPAGEPQQPQR